MSKEKMHPNAFAFAALLFQRMAECMNLAFDLLNGSKKVVVKVLKGKEV